MTTPVQPAKRFRLGAIQLNVWPNRDRAGRSYYTATIGRSYRDDKGKWSDTGSLRPSDLPVVRSLTAKALDWITANPVEATAEKQDNEPEPEPALMALLACIERQFAR